MDCPLLKVSSFLAGYFSICSPPYIDFVINQLVRVELLVFQSLAMKYCFNSYSLDKSNFNGNLLVSCNGGLNHLRPVVRSLALITLFLKFENFPNPDSLFVVVSVL